MSHELAAGVSISMEQTAVRPWYMYMLWVLAAGVLGFLIATVFAGHLRLPRAWVVLPYLILAGGFIYAYLRWSGTDVAALVRHNWVWGLLGALIVGAFVVKNVLSQPASPSSSGLALGFDLLWLGVVYGALDALLLSVVPILAAWGACSSLGWTVTWPGKIAAGLLAIVASLLVTALYHLGYPEYRGQALGAPVIGNGIMSLGYLLTANPLTAVFSHIAMHIAAVLHGPATSVQLPPHY
jgi:hypothetical protein